MRWEYVCLIRVSVQQPDESWGHNYTLHGSGGQKDLIGNGTIELLNGLGRESWELITVEESDSWEQARAKVLAETACNP